jgi:hypothetical protein
MRRQVLRTLACAALAAALLCSVSAARETVLAPVELPESVRPLTVLDAASVGAATPPGAAARAVTSDTEEVVVQGRSMVFLHDQLALAEDKLYAVYNDINTVDEFDIHCRMHATTGTRIPQRRCLPNFAGRLEERKGQAVLRNLHRESAFDLDWQTPGAQMIRKTAELEAHMQRLALEHPELLEAMRELYGLMQTVHASRYTHEDDEEP